MDDSYQAERLKGVTGSAEKRDFLGFFFWSSGKLNNRRRIIDTVIQVLNMVTLPRSNDL